MSDVYEYRREPNRGPVWIALFGVILLLVAVIQFDLTELMWLVSVTAAILITWMILPRPVFGIRIDDHHLILAAWRKPRHIALDDIAHLRIDDTGLETQVMIIYRNGNEEPVFAGDLPDIDTLIVVLAERGVPVREVS